MTLLSLAEHDRCFVETITPARRTKSVYDAVMHGLNAMHKSLPPMLLYDERGSRLFEEICLLPEYYPTRTEQRLLDDFAPEISGRFPRQFALVELGSGSSTKTRTLLDACFVADRRPHYHPIDISETMLSATARELADDYPKLTIHAIASDYYMGLQEVNRLGSGPRVLLFLGSNIGNFSQDEAIEFLKEIRASMADDDLLLLGTDMLKPLSVLLPAYDDAQGVTAAFNKNILVRLNRELAADFDLDLFSHHVQWNSTSEAVEMHLVSTVDQTVHLAGLSMEIHFAEGESIHTESSHKYSPAALDSLLGAAGLEVDQFWTDDQNWFRLNLVVPSL